MATGYLQRTRRNKGFWFRTGRGWYTGSGSSYAPLLDEQGKHFKNPADEQAAEIAFHRHKATQSMVEKPVGVTVREVCDRYLKYARNHGSVKTYNLRSGFLYDFVTGFPRRFRTCKQELPKSDRIHRGFGNILCTDLTRADVQDWLDAHPKWTNTRAPVVALLRAINYAKHELKLIHENPLCGLPKMKDGRRETYFTPEVEEAIYKYAHPALAMAIKVCIFTGARPGIEFASLEARHVQETDRGQIWRFPAHEAKGGKKERIIYTPKGIAEIVREQIKKYPDGKLFRDKEGKPWTNIKLSHEFRNLRKKLQKMGVLIGDAVIYSARHTFSKRMLGGYWGQQVSLEVLAGLLGNSVKVCWDHYAQWSPRYVAPFWTAINGQQKCD
jgi:integrase